MTTVGPSFRRVAEGADKDLIVKPILSSKLREAQWPALKIELPGQSNAGQKKRIDGWFHPSTHPTMPARQLYYYLAEPENWKTEPFSPESRISVTMGTLMHEFVEHLLIESNVLVRPEGTCVGCKKEHGKKKGQCSEHGVMDEVLMARGHMDGIISPALKNAGFEFKTSNANAMRSIQDLDAEAYKAKWPHYYAQNQEYMRMSGLPSFVVLFMGIGYPWDMREIHVDFDPEFAAGIESKYREVRRSVEIGSIPEECCMPRSKMAQNCPATSCFVKQLS